MHSLQNAELVAISANSVRFRGARVDSPDALLTTELHKLFTAKLAAPFP
jgi:hypothetical protein